MIEWERVVKVLRDTADKALEMQEHEVHDFQGEMMNPRFDRNAPLMRKEMRGRYSKEWVSGRIQGIADAIEAMCKSGPEPL